MSWLQCLVGNRYNLLQLWKKYEAYAESNGGRPENNCDVTSIPGYVIKKNSSRGAKHGPSERQKNVPPSETDAVKGRQQ